MSRGGRNGTHAEVDMKKFVKTLNTSLEQLKPLTESMEQENETLDRKMVAVLGLTKVGKSSFLNSLLGLTMIFRDRQVKENCRERKVLDVVEWERSDPRYFPVGHNGRRSETRAPRVYRHENGFNFCDFSGFFDSRGLEARVHQAVIMKKILSSAQKGVKMVLLLEENMFDVGAQLLVKESKKLLLRLFRGDEKLLLDNVPSIRVGITKVERLAGQEKACDLRELKYDFSQGGKAFALLAESMFVFDPHGKDTRYGPTDKMEDLMEKMKSDSFKPIENPQDVMSPCFTDEEYLFLKNICQQLPENVKNCLDGNNFEEVTENIYLLEELRHFVENSCVDDILKNTQEIISSFFQKLVESFKARLDSEKDASEQAEVCLQTFQTAAETIPMDGIKTHGNYSEMKKNLAIYKKKVEAKIVEKDILSKQGAFLERINLELLDEAGELCDALVDRREEVDGLFAATQMDNPLDVILPTMCKLLDKARMHQFGKKMVSTYAKMEADLQKRDADSAFVCYNDLKCLRKRFIENWKKEKLPALYEKSRMKRHFKDIIMELLKDKMERLRLLAGEEKRAKVREEANKVIEFCYEYREYKECLDAIEEVNKIARECKPRKWTARVKSFFVSAFFSVFSCIFGCFSPEKCMKVKVKLS